MAVLAASAAERWAGVDEAVVERLALEAGRRTWAPLLDAKGDLRIFLFLSAGMVGGFAAGYLYRLLFGRRGSSVRRQP